MGKRGNGEGSIYRRKDGRWAGQCTVQTITGPKRKTFYGKTRAEVAARLAKAIAESENGIAFDAGKMTVGAYLDSWLTDSVRGNVRPFAAFEPLKGLTDPNAPPLNPAKKGH